MQVDSMQAGDYILVVENVAPAATTLTYDLDFARLP
jgi:hypothetical protein